MAAVTVAAQEQQQIANPAFTVNSIRAMGLKHRRRGLITVTTSGDTFASGIRNIVKCAWEAVDSSDPIAVTFTAAGVVTFTGTNGSTGFLHIWSGS